MKIANMNAGKALRQLMARDNISRAKMAEVLDCTEPYISMMRKEKTISASKLGEVCEFFKISASEFFKLGEEQ